MRLAVRPRKTGRLSLLTSPATGIGGVIKQALSVVLLLAITVSIVRADSVVVFNEIMYHPLTNEPALEWFELYNQMAVDVDMSGWSITGGIDFKFAEGTVIPGRSYLVVALSPADLIALSGPILAVGPFTGRLSNGGEQLELRNNNLRLMDKINYGVEGDWPVGPDGSGVSLSKRDENSASSPARNWTVSAMVGGTPGKLNFPTTPIEVVTTQPVVMNGTWKYEAPGTDSGSAWQQIDFDDSGWSSGAGLFQAGTVNLPPGEPQPVPTAFSSGIDANGLVLAPGSPDPHYWVTQSAQSSPPPPPVPALAIQNHPAWAANDAQSSWIGVLNPGTENVAAGIYNYRTTFSLQGFDSASAVVTMNVGADNRLNDVLFNGISQGINFVGFASLSSPFTIATGFLPGTNSLDFLTANDDVNPNPAGFRVKLAVTARQQMTAQTVLPQGQQNYRFRTRFISTGLPQWVALNLSALVADGAVFYLNGAEVLRLNMPQGLITASTPALTNVTNPETWGPFKLSTASLQSGTNVLAVELHPAITGSNDVLFGCELSLITSNVLVPPPVSLAFNEFSSATNADYWIELINYGATDLDLGGYSITRLGGLTNREYVFPPRILAPGMLTSISRATLGFAADPGDRLFLYSPGRASVIDALVAKRQPRGRWPDGTGVWLYPTQPTPGASNLFVFHDAVVFNEIFYHPPIVLPPSTEPIETTLLPITARWRYNQTGANLGTNWVAPGYNDRAWSEGAALLYVESAALPAPKNTPLTLGPTTYYFRTPFVFTGSTQGLELRVRTVIDDGAVIYLNGQEARRINMRDGAFDYQTLAWPSVGDASYLGPLTLLTTNLVAGTNILAVEVHQASANSTDIVFGAELIASYPSGPVLPVEPPAESWIELHNRSSQTVDLTGWKLSHDLDYDFPAGTLIPANGYLVVAKDPGTMRTNYPGINVVGPFTNNLRRSSSHLLLVDPAGNPADEVRYFDANPWPAYPDGGGSSLELRDPRADNSKPEAWAASVESNRSTWTNVTYRATASNILGPTQWREFVLGLLDAGECLIDDLSVIESPTGTAVQMLQNGNFETGITAWRVLGTHSRSRVEVDPDNAANHVLHLIATGPTAHEHNHLETTFASGRSVVDGREYQVSFRAKWLAGNNQLNTRLYFNRVAKTTVLPRPSQAGTPGARNSTWANNLGPTCTNLSHRPVVPKANEPVTVGVNAHDPQGISAMTLRWSANGGAWNQLTMQPESAAIEPGYTHYSAVIPGRSSGTLVQFYVQAVDTLGASSTFPSGGTNSRALYKVNDGKAIMTSVHTLRLLMTAADASLLHAPTNVMSNDRLGLTVVYNDREVYYDAGVHLQSSERGRNDSSRVGFSVRFPADHLFRGVQNNITVDRSGGYSGLGGDHDEILLWHLVNHAGKIPGIHCDLVQSFTPRSQEDSTGLLRMSAFDGDYWDSQYDDGSDGNQYLLELIYYPTTTLTGDAQAPKLPQPDNVINVEIQDWGDDKENYRWIFRQENHEDADDYRQLIALNKAFSLTGTALETQIQQLMDEDQWMRALAFKAFTGDGDTFTYGLNHNWKIYFRPSDGKALGLLWDMDFAFAQSTTYSSPGSGSANTYKINRLPDNFRRFYGHLLELMTTTINPAYVNPWATHYSRLLGQNWSGAANYLQNRANYLRGTMPLTTPFAITSNGGKDFSTASDHSTLAGTASLWVQTITVNGLPYPLTWTSLTNWTLAVPLPNAKNLLVLQGLDFAGRIVTNATDSITITNTGQLALKAVVINEWMVDNSAPGGFPEPVEGRFSDWFELYNPNSVAVNLSGYFLTDTLSLPNLWMIPTNTTIAAGGFLLVWADNKTYLNGTADLHASFQLNKDGDTISLSAPDGTPQHTVVFGPQSQNVSQGLFPDGNTNAFNSMSDWTPRQPNRLGEPESPLLSNFTELPDGQVSFTVAVIPGRTYRVEWKNELSETFWRPLGNYYLATDSPWIVTDTLEDVPQRFYRVVLVP